MNYAVALSLGAAFTVILLLITWNNSLEGQAREFALVSSSIKDTASRNIQTANDTLSSLAAFLESGSVLNQQQYDAIASSLLGLHPFMEGAVFSTPSGTVSETHPFAIRYQTMRDRSNILPQTELLSDQAYTIAIKNLFDTDAIITLASEYSVEGWRGYWILKAVHPRNENAADMASRPGFVAILINTSKLVGANIGDTDFSIMLLSDSAGLSGRQFLYQKSATSPAGWQVTQLLEEAITQFPLYSVRLSISKDIPWQELDKSLIYIALLIGVGVTLLLVALIKAKDEQEQQLLERNAVIEAQVLAQTEELAHARDEALKASLMKSSFLASMSHEIRTPLNAIIGMSDLLSETELDYEQKKYVGVFKKAGDTLLSLVNDILDLSKIEANQLKLEHIEFNLIDTIEESVEIYALKAAEKEIELVCNIDPAIKPCRMGDPARLRQILLNLISNALKFTEHGEIIVSASIIDTETTDSSLLEIAVSDTGTGIPTDKLELIFASFTQADSSTTRKFGGTGLGLTISRSLVEMMDGRIWVESEPDKGSRFIFRVLLPVADRVLNQPLPHTGMFAGKQIMVIEDNQTSRDVLASYLRATGAGVICMTDTAGSLGYLDKPDNTKSCDLILVDAELPGVNGFDFIRGLRKKNLNIPTIMMLNPATLNQNQKNLDEIGNEQSYLTKPIKRKELYNQLESVLTNKPGDSTTAGVSIADSQTQPLTILLVDDNPDNRLLVQAYLKKLPYVLDEAENGEEAANKFMQGKYDIVLMDVQMPIMDGRESTRRIRAWEQEQGKKPTPIIALTAHAIKEEVDLCLEAGCDSHLSKPVKKETLITTIQAFF